MSNTHLQEYPVPGGIFPTNYVTPRDESILIAEGDGSYVTTESGEEYLDYKMGSGPLVVGHAHPDVVEAITDQAEKGMTFYIRNRPGLELAKRIEESVPCADRLKFTSSGTEATYLSLRIARAYTERSKVLKFKGEFHGWHDQALVSSNRADLYELEVEDATRRSRDAAGIDPALPTTCSSSRSTTSSEREK